MLPPTVVHPASYGWITGIDLLFNRSSLSCSPLPGIQNISVQSARVALQLQSLFHLPLSVEAFDQYQAFTSIVKTVRDTQDADIWTYVWGSSLLCSRNAYKHLIGHKQIHPVFRWLWKSSCQKKGKSFFCYFSRID